MSAEYVYRAGTHWGVTIIREQDCVREDGVVVSGSASLVAVALTQDDADLIIAALNRYEGAVNP
jgi:hypothetical protein